MSDTYDRRAAPRSSPMIFAILAVSVTVVVALMVWISERPGGEYVGVEAAPTEVQEMPALDESEAASEAAAMETDATGNVTEFSGTAVDPGDTNQFVTNTPAGEEAVGDGEATPASGDNAAPMDDVTETATGEEN